MVSAMGTNEGDQAFLHLLLKGAKGIQVADVDHRGQLFGAGGTRAKHLSAVRRGAGDQQCYFLSPFALSSVVTKVTGGVLEATQHNITAVHTTTAHNPNDANHATSRQT